MLWRNILCTLALFATAAANDGWKELFNGKNLDGWEHIGPGEFTVENGALRPHGGMGLLWHTGEKTGGAVLRVVYKSEKPESNSGVFIRIPEKPKDPFFAVHHGYEVQINDSADEFHRTGAIYSLSPAEEFPPSRSGWNTMDIILDGQLTVVKVNGKEVNRYDGTQEPPPREHWYEPRRGPRPDSGYIGLQNHDEESVVWFKRIAVRPLAAKADK